MKFEDLFCGSHCDKSQFSGNIIIYLYTEKEIMLSLLTEQMQGKAGGVRNKR